jgi:hypothetical protein
MEIDQFIDLYPQLFHMAAEGSWNSIRENGLLSTQAIVDSSRLALNDRVEILGQRRPFSVEVEHPILGVVSIRDQKPLRIQFLQPALTDMTIREWLEVLNSRVFFWPTREKLEGLLGAQQYRNKPQDVLTINTRSLLDVHAASARLSPINSGATLYPNAAMRGSQTFSRIEDFDYVSSRRRRGRANAIVELAVLEGVPDIRHHVERVDRVVGGRVVARLQ